MTFNTINHDEEEKGKEVEQPISSGEKVEDPNYPVYLNDLMNGNIQSYVSQQIGNGRIKILKDSKGDIRSKNYLTEEGWEVLNYSAQLLCNKPMIDSLADSTKYVNSVVGDNEVGREITQWLFGPVFADAQRVYNAGKNTVRPSNEKLESYVTEKKQLIEEIKEKYPNLDGLDDLSINDLKIELLKTKLN